MKNIKQKGFTLIELLIVIVILGILAVAVAPKFLDFSGQAKRSTAEGVEGSLRAAALLGKAQKALAGNNVYPPATVAGIGSYLDLQGLTGADKGDSDENNSLSGTQNYPGPAYEISVNDCFVSYYFAVTGTAASPVTAAEPTINSYCSGS